MKTRLIWTKTLMTSSKLCIYSCPGPELPSFTDLHVGYSSMSKPQPKMWIINFDWLLLNRHHGLGKHMASPEPLLNI
jgi:hypothetical protein